MVKLAAYCSPGIGERVVMRHIIVALAVLAGALAVAASAAGGF